MVSVVCSLCFCFVLFFVLQPFKNIKIILSLNLGSWPVCRPLVHQTTINIWATWEEMQAPGPPARYPLGLKQRNLQFLTSSSHSPPPNKRVYRTQHLGVHESSIKLDINKNSTLPSGQTRSTRSGPRLCLQASSPVPGHRTNHC